MRLSALHLTTALLLVALVCVGAAPAAASDDGNVTLYQVDADTDAEAAAVAVENGTATPTDRLLVNDTFVAVIESPRLADDMEAANGSATERFFSVLDGEAALRMTQTNPAPELATKLAAFGPDNTTVSRNGTTVYVLVDTNELVFERTRSGENEPEPVRDGERYAVAFGYNLSSFPREGPEVELYTAPSRLVGSPSPPHDALPAAAVNRSVKVNIAPTERHVVRVELATGRTITAPVEPVEWSGFQAAALDLGDAEPGTAYTLELVHDGDTIERYEGTITEPTPTPPPEPSTATDSPTEAATDTQTDAPPDEQPGFGAVAAVLALFVAGLGVLGIRRP